MAFRERLHESRKSETAVRKDPLSLGYTRDTFEGTGFRRRKVYVSPAILPSLTLRTNTDLLFYVQGKNITWRETLTVEIATSRFNGILT